MYFSNKEIIEYLAEKIQPYLDVKVGLFSEDDKVILQDSKDNIKYICFDGNEKKFFISFYGHQTSIYVSDENQSSEQKFTFNEEFMFIDDKAKTNIVSSDTYRNIVYEGILRYKTHKEILEILADFIVLLNGTKKSRLKGILFHKQVINIPNINM